MDESFQECETQQIYIFIIVKIQFFIEYFSIFGITFFYFW